MEVAVIVLAVVGYMAWIEYLDYKRDVLDPGCDCPLDEGGGQ